MNSLVLGSDVDLYLDRIGLALRDRSVLAPRSMPDDRRRLTRRFADAVVYTARQEWAKGAPFPEPVLGIAFDGLHLTGIRLAHASEQLAIIEAGTHKGDGVGAMRSVIDLPVADRGALAAAVVTRFTALHRAIGPDETLLLRSPVLVVSADQVFAARRANPEADDRMVARALSEFPTRVHRTLTAMTANYRAIVERNSRLGAGLSDDELRDLAAYRVVAAEQDWADCDEEYQRLHRCHREAIERDFLSDELLRYILVFRSGEDAADELERLLEARHELRRRTSGYTIPASVYLTALRRSVDLHEAVQRVEVFRLLRFAVRVEHRGIAADESDRVTASRMEHLEPALRDPEQRITLIAALDARINQHEVGLEVG